MTDNWDIIITNKSRLFSLDLHEVWRYRDLLMMYMRRDIVTFYKQTILGPLWTTQLYGCYLTRWIKKTRSRINRTIKYE